MVMAACRTLRGSLAQIIARGVGAPLVLLIVTSIFYFSCLMRPTNAADDPLTLIGPQDALLVTAPDGTVILSANATQKQVPASTLKLLTSLVALHYLGPDFRFSTDFYLDQNQNLKIKGYGDPLLISEVVDLIAQGLSRRLSGINDIILDTTYYAQPILIPGRSASYQPYDAPNGALCVNFNTVKFTKNRAGRYVSGEAQIPLIPFILPRIRASGVNTGRIVLSQEHDENVRYAGHIFSHFMKKQGIECRGIVRPGTVDRNSDRLILHYTSPYTLETVIAKLLEYSNNYIANQLLIAAGVKVHGAPGTLQKGVRAGRLYVENVLGTTNIQLVEGSGLSRQNRISARDMERVLTAFEPYRHCMTRQGRAFYKTGTLDGIRTCAGYIERGAGGWYRFVVMMNTPGKSAKKVVARLQRTLP